LQADKFLVLHGDLVRKDTRKKEIEKYLVDSTPIKS